MQQKAKEKVKDEKDLAERLNLEEGTIEFWARAGKIRWNDGLIQVLINISNEQGNIFIVKDSDNKLKFFHVLLGKGRTDVEIDVSDLGGDKDHHIAATWSINNKQIALYIDGGEKFAKSEIKY
jgi:hypothetical protein